MCDGIRTCALKRSYLRTLNRTSLPLGYWATCHILAISHTHSTSSIKNSMLRSIYYFMTHTVMQYDSLSNIYKYKLGSILCWFNSFCGIQQIDFYINLNQLVRFGRKKGWSFFLFFSANVLFPLSTVFSGFFLCRR